MGAKTFKTLRKMGVSAAFGEAIEAFQSDYDLGTVEMILLLQSYQMYLVDTLATDNGEDDE